MNPFDSFELFFSALNSSELLVVVTSFLFVLAALFLWKQKKETVSLFFVCSAVFMLGLFYALRVDILFFWDEQYHAVVASNLATNPFRPVLIHYGSVPYDKTIWISNEIWLHKQPLSLWQMALSIKVFGNSIFAVRFPSVLLHVLSTLLVYHIGRRMGKSTPAFFAAIFFGTSGYLLAFVSGAEGMDHVDTAFTFYILLSTFAFLRYLEKSTWKRALLVGLFVGMAVLTKWLVGLVVLGAWGILLLVRFRKNGNHWKNYGLAWIIALLVFIPWQIYCSIAFPEEFAIEMAYNKKHFFEAVEGHRGTWSFYWDRQEFYFNANRLGSWILGVLALLYVYFTFKSRSVSRSIVLLIFLMLVLFFSAAATKLNGYVNMALAFYYLMIAFAISDIWDRYMTHSRLKLAATIFVAILFVPLFGINFNVPFTLDRYDFKFPEAITHRRSQADQISNILKKHGKQHTYLLKNDQTILLPQILFDNPGYRVLYYFEEVPYKNPYEIDVTKLH